MGWYDDWKAKQAPKPAPERREPTLEERLALANAKQAGGLQLFQQAAQQLEQAGAQQRDVVNDAENRIVDLQMLAAEAASQEAKSIEAAQRVRGLIGE